MNSLFPSRFIASGRPVIRHHLSWRSVVRTTVERACIVLAACALCPLLATVLLAAGTYDTAKSRRLSSAASDAMSAYFDSRKQTKEAAALHGTSSVAYAEAKVREGKARLAFARASVEEARFRYDAAVTGATVTGATGSAGYPVYKPGAATEFRGHLREAESQLREARAGLAKAESALQQARSPAPAALNSNSNCEPSLAYLASKLPKYADADLALARAMILQTEIKSVIQQMNAQGYNTSQGARLLIEQGKQFEAACASARDSALSVASSPAEVKAALDAIDAGRPLPPSGPQFDDSMVGQALKAYVIAVWGRLANRETAIQIACHARS